MSVIQFIIPLDFQTIEVGEIRELYVPSMPAPVAITITGYEVRKDGNLEVTPPFAVVDPSSYPIDVAAGESIPSMIVRFSPVEANTYSNYEVRLLFNALGGPPLGYYYVTASGASTYSPPKLLSVQPTTVMFPDTKENENSSIKTVTVLATTLSGPISPSVTITTIDVDDQFELISPTTFPIVLAPGEAVTLQVRFTPDSVGNKSVADMLTINSDAENEPHLVAAVALAYDSAVSPVAGLDTGTMLAFASGDTVAVKFADEYDLNCEEIQEMSKVLDFGLSGIDKTITGVYLQYEDYGVANLAVTVLRRVKKEETTLTQLQAVQIGSTLENEKPLRDKAINYTLDAEFLELKIYKEADSGPFSLIELLLKYLLERKLRGSYTIPNIAIDGPSVGGYNSTNAALFFVNDSREVTVKTTDGTDLNCEEDAYWIKNTIFDADLREKSIMRLWSKVEDMGEATMSLQVTTPRMVADPVAVTFGLLNDERVLNVAWNVIVSGEWLELKMSRAADSGKISMINYTSKIEPRGELVES